MYHGEAASQAEPMLKFAKNLTKGLIRSTWPVSLMLGGGYQVKTILKRINNYGITLELDINEAVDRLYAFGLYSTKSIDFLVEIIKIERCQWFVDAGANLGFYSYAVASQVSSSLQCLCIEPDPYSQKKIKVNNNLNPALSRRISLAPVALSETPGTMDLMINDAGNRGGSSVFIDQRSYTGKQNNTIVKVRSQQLQSVCSDYFDLNDKWCLKIDIEGYEFPVLESFFQSVQYKQLPKAIVVEWTGNGKLGPDNETPIQLISRYGYALVAMDGAENYLFKQI